MQHKVLLIFVSVKKVGSESPMVSVYLTENETLWNHVRKRTFMFKHTWHKLKNLKHMATIRTKARTFSPVTRKTVIFLLGIGALVLLLV